MLDEQDNIAPMDIAASTPSSLKRQEQTVDDAPSLTLPAQSQRAHGLCRLAAMVGAVMLLMMGTDSLGHDLFSRLLYGARIALWIGLLVVTIEVAIGMPLGMISAYFRGQWDLAVVTLAGIVWALPTVAVSTWRCSYARTESHQCCDCHCASELGTLPDDTPVRSDSSVALRHASTPFPLHPTHKNVALPLAPCPH